MAGPGRGVLFHALVSASTGAERYRLMISSDPIPDPEVA
jgi:hypothetical protein